MPISSKVPNDRIAVAQVPALLSVRTTAQLLDVSPRTVRRRIDEGVLPAVRENDRTMIRADELRAYIDGLERVGNHGPTRHRRTPPIRYDSLRS